MRKCIPLIVVVILASCSGVRSGKNPDQIEIAGKVTRDRKPITDVTITLQAIKGGTQATYSVKNGEFKGTATPGRYTYFFTEGSNPTAFVLIPEKYHSGSMDRQIDIDSGTNLMIVLD